MEKHPKSLALELLTKNSIQFPVTSFSDNTTKTNEKEFICKLETFHPNNPIFMSNIWKTKKDSEKEAFELYLNYINENDNIDMSKLIINTEHIKKNIIIIIDYENVSNQKEIEKLYNSLNNNSNVKIIKIVSYASPLKNNLDNNCDIIVRSNRKDAVDHYIGYYIGITNSSNESDNLIYVISKDHFASCIQDFCANVYHAFDINDCINLIITKINKN